MNTNIIRHSYGLYLSAGTLVIAVLLVILPGLVFTFKYALALIEQASLNTILMLLGSVCYFFLGMFALVPQEEFQINPEEQVYRNAVVIFNRQYGEWEKLGSVKYLSIVVKKSSIETASSRGNVDASFGVMRSLEKTIVGEYQLRLFKGPGRYIEIDSFEEKEKVIETGLKFAKGLHLKLLDASTKPANFIEG